MSENISSAQQLFQAGLTREQFIQKYTELQQANATQDSSIFSKDFANSIGEIFDKLNTDGNETLDESEITTLQGLGDNDNTTLSEADLKELYKQIGQTLLNKPTGSPEEMYRTAMVGGDPNSNTYIENLNQQIETLQELITLRQFNSTNIQQGYQDKIDDIIKKDTNLSLEQKTEYTQLSKELATLKREADKNQAEMKRVEEELRNNDNQIKLAQTEIDALDPNNEEHASSLKTWTEDLNRLNSERSNLSFEYQKLSAKQSAYNTKITAKQKELDKKSDEIKAGNPGLKAKIEKYEQQIKDEKASAETEIQGYENQIKTLRAAQAYAIEQIKNTPPAAETSGEASHDNDNLMSFDELKAMGLEYSSENGQKLASTVKSHARGFTGYCSRYVSNALAESGLGKERAGAAADMDTLLEKNSNFKEIKISSAEDLKRLPAGCILVYERGAARYSSKYGHIEVTLGNGTAGSDGITHNLRYTENMSVFVPVKPA